MYKIQYPMLKSNKTYENSLYASNNLFYLHITNSTIVQLLCTPCQHTIVCQRACQYPVTALTLPHYSRFTHVESLATLPVLLHAIVTILPLWYTHVGSSAHPAGITTCTHNYCPYSPGWMQSLVKSQHPHKPWNAIRQSRSPGRGGGGSKIHSR